MAATLTRIDAIPEKQSVRDIAFALGIIAILAIFFLPIPAFLIDFGISCSVALSVLILMVSLWIKKPLEFSSFPTILLVATMLRLSLNIATTRLILSHGAEGTTAAGNIIGAVSRLVMGGDFVIGLIVFIILITVNFLVITKGATRIAEVGARFTLDAIPGKQMAIDADLSAGIINEQQAQLRRRELEEESAFFGSMDGASKFVRGDAIAGLIILAVNVFGGMVIGILRHHMGPAIAADIFTKLSVGDGLVTQIPALIVSLAAGLLVSKGGTVGSAEQAVINQLANYPRAMLAAAGLMFMMALIPGMPFLPFICLFLAMTYIGYVIPRQQEEVKRRQQLEQDKKSLVAQHEAQNSIREVLRPMEIEIVLGKQVSGYVLGLQNEFAHRVKRMRRKFALDYGFVIPDIKLTDDWALDAKKYKIKIHSTLIAQNTLQIGKKMIVYGGNAKPALPGDDVTEPAYAMNALWILEEFSADAKAAGYMPVDCMSVLLTHISEVIKNNLAQLLSYKDMSALLDRLEPEYKKLLSEITPTHISNSGLQAILKLLLAEKVSIRNLHLILEAIAEIAPYVRRSENVAEHVRVRMASQICGDLCEDGVLKVLRLGSRWDRAFHGALKRDQKGDVLEFDMEPGLIEQFVREASAKIRHHMDEGEQFVVVALSEARPYVRMILERVFASVSVLSHLEIARGANIKPLGTISDA